MAGTTKKKITARGKNQGSARKKRGAKDKAVPEFIRTEFILILSFAFAVILFLSNFHLCGNVGDFLRGVQLGVFGKVGYAAPVLLFTGICFYLSNVGNKKAAAKLAAVIAALMALCGLFHLLFGRQEAADILKLYQSGVSGGQGGGALGGALSSALLSVLGRAGTYVVLAVVLVICIVYITEKSLVSAVKSGGGKAYQHAREDVDRRMELHAIRKEERRLKREEEKIRGVNLSATKIGEVPVLEEEGSAQSASAQEEALLDSYSYSSPQGAAEFISGEPEPSADEAPFIPEDEVPFDEYEAPVFSHVIEEGALFADRDPRTLEEMDVLDNRDGFHGGEEKTAEFSIPDEAKRVVTSAGKVIETDTEVLQKKLESKRAEAEAEGKIVREQIHKAEPAVKKKYQFPPLSLLKRGERNASNSQREYRETAAKLQQTLKNFGVGVTVTNISCGPSVTRYELYPEQGVKVSRIVGLADDIKLSLAAADIRIEAPIPGKSAVGIEVPNKENNMVLLRDLLESDAFRNHSSRVAFAVGKDIGGQVVVTDIARMPHLLIAGATGSGKSVCINTLIMSIIFKSDPADVKMIMVDPKVVELSVYNGIPHLMIPVVTDPKKASAALNWAVAEMTDRYQKFADYNVRDLKGYNEKLEKLSFPVDGEKPEKLPQIVIIIDELADLMMVAPGEVEDSICRLAQLARAAGIHLVIATQRPSVNVITGLIKANVPSRIAFAVSSGVDSRTIIDMNGAEKLLGKGDMLFYPSGYPKPVRVQGAFISDQEVSRVVNFLNQQGMTAAYSADVENKIAAAPAPEQKSGGDGRDEYFIQAGRFIIEKEKASIGMLQRMFKIGFNRAARIMDQLSEAGVVGEEEGTKPRKVLMTMEEFDAMMNGGS